jgi:hypothetical protein
VNALVDPQCAFVEWPPALKVALSTKQAGKILENRRGIGMLGAEHVLVDPCISDAHIAAISIPMSRGEWRI